MDFRVGIGYDVHSFSKNRKLIIGGVEIPSQLGLLGHSDADVLVHAIIDALLGASNLGDIGKLFPDNDKSFKDISSLKLLKKVYTKLIESGYQVVNIDSVVICEKPKISDYSEKMRNALSENLGNLDIDNISIKGKTSEKLGFAGRSEGIASQAVCLLKKN